MNAMTRKENMRKLNSEMHQGKGLASTERMTHTAQIVSRFLRKDNSSATGSSVGKLGDNPAT